jgi:hypothetical protein
MNEKFEALKSLGAGDFEHLNGTLIAHLKGTRDILISWGASSVLCDSGLYHAAYGTDGFDESLVSLTQRNDIAALIGKEAEELVYLYCSCDRGYVFPKIGLFQHTKFKNRFSGYEFSLTNKQSKLFCELTVANEMELVCNSQGFKGTYGDGLLKLFESMKAFLSERAIQAYRQELLADG